MCLIAFAWQAHPRYDLIVAANRDEFYQRPTERAHWWPSTRPIFAGRDERAGGAWCAADRLGRFAAVTNVREPRPHETLRSRGDLVRDALANTHNLDAYGDEIQANGGDYGPFNLLLADHDQLQFLSNRGRRRRVALSPGVYAISNGHWDEDWPKTIKARDELQRLIAADDVTAPALFALLGERDTATASPVAEIGPDTEQLLSALFVHSSIYGTRASTLLLRERSGNMDFHERAFDRDTQVLHDQHEHWSCTCQA